MCVRTFLLLSLCGEGEGREKGEGGEVRGGEEREKKGKSVGNLFCSTVEQEEI